MKINNAKIAQYAATGATRNSNAISPSVLFTGFTPYTGYRTSSRYHTVADIVGINEMGMEYDVIAKTPGGSVITCNAGKTNEHKYFYFSVASNEAIKREFLEKKYILVELDVDGARRIVLQESENGDLSFKWKAKTNCKLCGRRLGGGNFYMNIPRAYWKSLRLLASPIHRNSPKFELRIVDKRQTRGQLWLALERAERARV